MDQLRRRWGGGCDRPGSDRARCRKRRRRRRGWWWRCRGRCGSRRDRRRRRGDGGRWRRLETEGIRGTEVRARRAIACTCRWGERRRNGGGRFRCGCGWKRPLVGGPTRQSGGHFVGRRVEGVSIHVQKVRGGGERIRKDGRKSKEKSVRSSVGIYNPPHDRFHPEHHI